MGSYKNPMSCGAQCSRITLVTFNIIFLLCGIAFLILGLVFKFGNNSLKAEIETTLQEVTISSYNLYDLANDLAILFIVSGAIIIAFSALGFIGACCMVRCVLVFYAILIGICLALELAGVVLFFVMRNEFEKGVQTGLTKSIKVANGDYPDIPARDQHQKSVEYLFREFKCCHVNNIRLNDTGDASGTCDTMAESYMKDCYDALKEWVEQYQIAFIVIGVIVMVIELLLIVCACWICRAAGKKSNIA